MTPKEKAEELVKKMFHNLNVKIDQNRINEAKQCALTAVNEILKRNQPVQGHFWSYWEQVKEEINLL
jgi:hypothetical protein